MEQDKIRIGCYLSSDIGLNPGETKERNLSIQGDLYQEILNNCIKLNIPYVVEFNIESEMIKVKYNKGLSGDYSYFSVSITNNTDKQIKITNTRQPFITLIIDKASYEDKICSIKITNTKPSIITRYYNNIRGFINNLHLNMHSALLFGGVCIISGVIIYKYMQKVNLLENQVNLITRSLRAFNYASHVINHSSTFDCKTGYDASCRIIYKGFDHL